MVNKEGPIIVFGGTGHYGSKIVKSLLLKNVPVRVLSRFAQKAREILGDRVEIIEGDVTSQEVVAQSLKGTKAIVISLSAITPKLIKKMKQIERDAVLTIMKEAEKAKISRLVYLSGYDLRKDFLEKHKILQVGEIKLEIEKAINDSDFNWTILGCPPSFDLFFAFLRKNKMGFPGGGKNYLPTISSEDLGEIAAQAVIRDDLRGNRIKLTGPEALSIPEAARKISKITNTEIKPFAIPLVIFKLISMITLILVIIVITLSLFKQSQITRDREINEVKQDGSKDAWCASCGTVINTDALYCSECGKYYSSE